MRIVRFASRSWWVTKSGGVVRTDLTDRTDRLLFALATPGCVRTVMLHRQSLAGGWGDLEMIADLEFQVSEAWSRNSVTSIDFIGDFGDTSRNTGGWRGVAKRIFHVRKWVMEAEAWEFGTRERAGRRMGAGGKIEG